MSAPRVRLRWELALATVVALGVVAPRASAADDVAVRVEVGAELVRPGRPFPLTVVRTWRRGLEPSAWDDRALAPQRFHACEPAAVGAEYGHAGARVADVDDRIARVPGRFGGRYRGDGLVGGHDLNAAAHLAFDGDALAIVADRHGHADLHRLDDVDGETEAAGGEAAIRQRGEVGRQFHRDRGRSAGARVSLSRFGALRRARAGGNGSVWAA